MNMLRRLPGLVLSNHGRRRLPATLVALLLALAFATLLGASAGSAPAATGATLNAPTTPILDTFSGRGNEDPLYQWGGWAATSIDGEGHTMEIIGGSAGHDEGDFVGADSYRQAVVSGDAEVYATIPNVPGNNEPIYLYLHLNNVGGPSWSGYRVRIERWVSSVPDRLRIQLISGGAVFDVTNDVGLSGDLQAGDSFMLRETGGTLIVSRGRGGVWTQITAGSGGAFAGGSIGFGSDDNGGRWDDFGGSGPQVPPPVSQVPLSFVLDNFDRQGPEDPLSQGGEWAPTAIDGAGQTLEILDGDHAGQNEGSFISANSYRVDDFAGDAEVWGTIGLLPGNNSPMNLYLHLREVDGLGWDGYRMRYERWVSTTPDTVRIDKMTNGVPAQLGIVSIGPDPLPGDAFLFRRVGIALEGWYRSAGVWRRVLGALDNEYQNGKFGLGVEDPTGRWDDFGGGDLMVPTVQPAGPNTGVCDGSGTHASTASGCQDDPVNSLTGAFITSSADLRLPGMGVPFAWTRTYTSGDTTAGRLGPGWTDSYNTSLVIEQNGDVRLRGDEGQQIEYTRQQDGSFVGESGARSRVESVTGGYRLTRSDQVVYLFDAQGRLTSMKDRNNQGLTFAYNAGDLQTITDSVGRQIAVQVNAGLVSRVTLPDGRYVEYGYTGGRLTSVRDASGATTTYTYDAGGRLDTIVDQNQHTVVDNTYGSDGRVIQQVNARGHSGTFSWDPATTTSTYTDSRLNQWKDVYVDGVLAERIDPLGNRTRFEYDDDFNVSRVIDARNNATTFTYDNRGNLLTRTGPAPVSPQEVWTYNVRNDPLTYQDPRANITEFGYDAAGNLTSATGPDADGPGPLGRPQTQYGRDPAGTGQLVSVTDPRGKQTTFSYTNGNVTEVRTPLGNRTTMGYDGSGRLTSLVEPRGNAAGGVPADFRWTYTYDALDHLETQTDPLTNVTGLDFDPVGNLLSRTDANQHATTYGYDVANNLTSVTAPDPDGAGPVAAPVTRYAYDTAGNLTSRENANQRTTTYGYDAANRLTTMTSPGNRTWTYGYDPVGNLTQLVDANGNATPTAGDGQTTNAYDVLDRLTSIDYSDTPADVTFLYDPNGNRTTMTDGSGTETYAYDPLNRLTSVTRGTSTISYAYDLANLTRRTYPGAVVVDYLYDDDGRMQRATSGAAQTNYAYDVAGNLATTTLPSANGYVESRAYDRAGRLTEVRNQRGATVLSGFVSTLDPVGNRLQVVRTGSLAQTQAYTYDGMDRLTGVCFQASCPGASDPYIRWTYDAMGNRLTETRPTGTTSYTYNEADELTQAGTTAYTYDQNGNQLSAGAQTFTYDLANRLRSAAHGTTSTTYVYDGSGKRLVARGAGTTSAPTLRTPCSTAIGASSSATVAKPAGTVAGDVLIVGLAFEKGSDTTITPPTGWTLIRRTNQTTDVGYATYRKTAGASEPASYSFGLTNGPKWSIGSCAIAGADPSTPIEVHNGATGSSGNPSAPSVTTTGPSRLVLAFYSNKKHATFSGYTSPAVERWDVPNGPGGLPSNAMASYTQTTAGATGAKSAVASEQEKWVAQQIAISSGASTPGYTEFLWDPSFDVPQLALERDIDNTTLRSYTYGARRIGQTAGSSTSYYLHDQLGSVANVTSSSGATEWTYAYEPFGTTRTETSTGGPANSMKFTGEYIDPTGLYHLRARQYDATTGRFLGRDPLAAPLLESYASIYPYSLNRPTLLVDPTGLRWCGGACDALDAIEEGLVGTAELIEERKVDLLLGVATIGCVAVAGPLAPGCLVLATVTFGASITSSAVESGVIGDKPANVCQFALSAGASTVLFGTGQGLSMLWKQPYVLSAIDQRILGVSTEVITGGLDVLSGAGAGAACK